MKPVRITPKADHDVDEIYEWLHRENPARANRFLEAVDQTIQAVSQMPGIGSRRYAHIPLMPGMRMVKVKQFERYLLFYLERNEFIDIIRIVHSARNLPEALNESE